MDVLTCGVMQAGKALQIWGLLPVHLSRQEPPHNSVLGFGLRVNISFASHDLRSRLWKLRTLRIVVLCICQHSMILNDVECHWLFANEVSRRTHSKMYRQSLCVGVFLWASIWDLLLFLLHCWFKLARAKRLQRVFFLHSSKCTQMGPNGFQWAHWAQWAQWTQCNPNVSQ